MSPARSLRETRHRFAPSPIPVLVTNHPYIAGRYTHLVQEADARRRGWLFFGDAPFGVWRTRQAARQAACRLQARGLVIVQKVVA